MELLPEGTRRRRWFEAADRWLGQRIFGTPRLVSASCGDQIVAGDPCRFCKIICRLLDLLEKDHCRKNAGKP